MITIISDSTLTDHGGSSWNLSPGDIFPFGGGDQAELKIVGRHLPDIIGQVHVSKYNWSVENVVPEATIVVENTNGCDFLTIQGGMRLPIPFTSSRVIVLCTRAIFTFSVCALNCIRQSGAASAACGVGQAAPLDRGAKYFRILIALCEPAIRNGLIADVPSSTDMVRRLRRIPEYCTITKFAVDFHLNYLYSQKLGPLISDYFSVLGTSMPPVGQYRRIRLVQFALRFGLVTPHDLKLLEEPPRA